MADKELEDFILHLNREAMTYLKDENYQLSLKTLKDAEKLLKTLNSPDNFKLQGITLNNFGCFYKRINKPNVALKFLQRACEKESVEPIDRVNLSGTLLNLCAIYSQLGKHDQALDQGVKALNLLEQEREKSPNLVSTLIIAYHNTGVEYEYLNNLKQAVECFKSAWTFAVKQLGETNSLTQSIHKTYVDALEKLEKTEQKSSHREQQRVSNRIKSQDRRNMTALPVIKRENNPYIKPKNLVPKKEHQTKIPELGMLDKAPVLNQVRFLTGDRLQPMFQMKTQRIQLRPVSKDLAKTKEKITEVGESEEAEEAKHFRTASAPVNVNLGGLQERIKKLEGKYEDFDKKLKPIKDSLPDLDSFKFESITAAYEIEKLSELDNKRKKIEEEKEKFLQNMKKMEEIEKKLKNEKEKERENEEIEGHLELDEGADGKAAEGMDGEAGRTDFENRAEVAEEKVGMPKDEKRDNGFKVNDRPPLRNPLTSTQACFQGYAKRKRLDRRTQAAIIIQKHVRRHQCRSIYLEIKEAIVFIQSVYRGHLVRKRKTSHL